MNRAPSPLWPIAIAAMAISPEVFVRVRLRHPARNRLPRDFLCPGCARAA